MKNFFLGSNPRTSYVGYILAGLYALQTALKAQPAHWYDVLIPVALAVFGRIAGDSSNSLNNP